MASLVRSFLQPSAPCVEWISSSGDPEWDAFVQAHPRGKVYDSNGWLRALADAFPHIRSNIAIVRDPASGRIRSGIPLCLVRSWLLGNRLSSLPLAPASTPLLACPQDFSGLLQGIQARVDQFSLKSVEIKIAPSEGMLVHGDWEVLNLFQHHYIDLRQGWLTLKSAISKSCRRMAEKARQSGVSVAVVPYAEKWPVFHQLFEVNRRRLGLPIIPHKFFAALHERLNPATLVLLLATRAGVALGALVCLKFKEEISAEFIGEADLDGARLQGINQLLYWEAIRLACEQSCQQFSFGRTAKDNIGLLEFKRRWATIEEDAPMAVFPANRFKEKTHLVNGTKAINWFFRHSPLWAYRQASNFCYRHWG